MSIEWITILMIGSFIALLAAGLPLAFATGAVAVIFAIALFGASSLNLIVSRVFTLMGNYVLVSVPLFILMACILERAGVAEDLFHAVHVWSGRLRGGLAVAVIVSCALMAAMVGVIGAEVVTMGVVALPAMLSRRYSKDLALGSICAGGGLATLIPPSVVFIMYGLTAGVSVGQLYMAGVVPGLLLAGLYVTYIVIRCYLQPELAPAASLEERGIRLREKLALLRGLVLPAGIALGVLGSLYAGLATPTEAAGVGCVGAFVAAAVNRRLTWSNVGRAVADTTKVTCMLYWLFFGASTLIGVYTLAGGTNFMKQAITTLPIGRWGILAMMMAIWVVLGCLIDWIGILLLTAPIFVPIIESLGFNSVWFGVLFCMNMQISYVSPPFGPAVFYLKGVTPPDIAVGDIFHSVWPFLALQVVALLTVILFPPLALWLPSLMIK